MTHPQFVHLHNHTEYSLLDGGCRIADLVGMAAKMGMPAVAITDHGNMHGVIDFYKAAREAGVKPIIGMEAYVAPQSRKDRRTHGVKDASFHLVLLAKDEEGYCNLIKLSTAAHLEGFYYKPRIDREILAEHRAGLIVLSACLKGEIPCLILKGEAEQAKRVALFYRDLFGEDFYLELHNHDIPEQQPVNVALAELAKDLSIPLVATNDVHYIKREDAEAHDVLLCIQTGNSVADEKRLKFATDQFYLRTPEEMARAFPHHPQALSNTLQIAEKCNLEIDFSKQHYPIYHADYPGTLRDYLSHLCEEGLPRRYSLVTPEIRQRLDYEIGVIDTKGLTSYILIVWDFVHSARQKAIPVGPGRGSAVGSLVCYLLGISDIDPLKYGLPFERFINPERPSFPDIDIDLCYNRRNEVIDYVIQKYGKSNVAQIITFGTLGAKMAVRDVGRALGYPYAPVDRVARLIPAGPNVTLEDALRSQPELHNLHERDEMVRRIFRIALQLEGLARNASTHAAGVVISSEDLTNLVPLCRGSNDEIVTQYAMKPITDIGLLKMDFLGLKTLTVIDEAVKMVQERHGVHLDMTSIALDDSKTFRLLKQAKTAGVFQLESPGMQDLSRKLKPDCFEDLVATIALFRPGPMEMIPDFISRKRNKSRIQYDDPLLEPILKETYGIFVYQEQVMRCANVLAGFSLAQSDVLRRSMGKKKPEEMAALRETFIEGARNNGVSQEVAEKVFDTMQKFSLYGFNKCHSAAYAFIVYQTAFLKANYPREYMAALLSNEIGNTERISRYVRECDSLGIKILPPDINESQGRFTVVGDGIRFGLSAVKNVGKVAIDHIVERRTAHGAFTSLYDFARSVDLRIVNRKVMESLIKCGAFDSTGWKRSQLYQSLDRALELASRTQLDHQKGQTSLFDFLGGTPSSALDYSRPSDAEEYPKSQLLKFEKELLGFYLTGHPLDSYAEKIKQLGCSTIAQLEEVATNSRVRLPGIISAIRNTVKKSTQERMSILTLEDLDGTIEVLVFPEAYKKCSAFLNAEEPVLVIGRLNKKELNPKIVADDVVPLDQADAASLDRPESPTPPADRPEKKAPRQSFDFPVEGSSLGLSDGITIRLDAGAEPHDLLELKGILLQFPGTRTVRLLFCRQNDRVVLAEIHSDVRVSTDKNLLDKLRELPYVKGVTA
ncbi:MAG: DNA polymerase III subunit alpha [bacterium]|nr:DNA polymerase III subunit alpha [bacterium]